MIRRDVLGMQRRAKFLKRIARKSKRGIRRIDGEAFRLLQDPKIKKRPFILLWLLMLIFGYRLNDRKAED